MRINESETIVAVDVDGSLVKQVPSGYDGFDGIEITNPYDDKTYTYVIHREHVDLLRQYAGRGFYIKVWSAGGVKHAVSVVRALGLNDGTVKEVETKPIKHVDDKRNPVHIVGSHVFIPKTGWSEEV